MHLIVSLIIGALWVAALTLICGMLGDTGERLGRVLLDRQSSLYPLTIQSGMWLAFFVGLGELWLRYRAALSERATQQRNYLPEDERTVLQGKNLNDIYARVKDDAVRESTFLPRLIWRLLLQFHSSRSIEQTNALLNSSLELYAHEIELRYNLLRYLSWLIPTLGFIGTVVGIASALEFAGQAAESPTLLPEVVSRLAVAFNTTLVALILSAILVFLLNTVQREEEGALNRSGVYCLDNLITRLYVSPREKDDE